MERRTKMDEIDEFEISYVMDLENKLNILNSFVDDAKKIKPKLSLWGNLFDPLPPGAVEVAILINKLLEIYVEEVD